VFPAVKSTIAICDCPVSHTVINLSDSREHDPNFIFSNGHESGALLNCRIIFVAYLIN
jgi:hypothetical protein